jgi:Ca2+-binding RTX toxin-like protein
VPTVIDLSNLGSRGFVIQGDAAEDKAGYSVSSAGDVNGDGFADLIIGAPFNDSAGDLAGEAYVVFGKASGFGRIDLSGLTAAQGFIVRGDAAWDGAGCSVSSAGDINGDGFDEIIIGANFGNDGGSSAGEAYVIFGKASGFGTADPAGRRVIDLTGLTAAQGFIIQGDGSFDLAGDSVSSAGDVNGDGLDDMIVGARYGDGGGAAAGESYVIFGRTSGFGTLGADGRKVVDLTNLPAAQGFVIQGDLAGDQAGVVSSAGDVNGDGFDDIIVGAPRADDGGVDAGEAYVIFGKAGGFAATGPDGRQVLDLTGLAAAAGFIIKGDAAGDKAGTSVSSAGDINADGFDDIIVGASRGDDGATNAGEAYLIFGKASGFGTIDLTSLAAGAGFVIRGDAASDYAGGSVSSAGDVNGDGFDDLIVGASGGDDGGVDAGEAYVIFGKASGFATVDLGALSPSQGFIIQGDLPTDFVGRSVSGAGDVNGDGFADLIVGATGADGGGSGAGGAYVIFGAAPTTAVTRAGTAIGQTIRGGAFNDILSGLGGADLLFGAAGNDTLNGGTGLDRTEGGAGNDTHIVDSWTDVVVERAGEGTADRVLASVSYTLAAGVQVEALSTTNNSGTGAINLTGNEFANSVTGNAGANILKGMAGNDILAGSGGIDRLEGGTGNDTLNGGSSADTMLGEAGDDTYYIDNAADRIVETLITGSISDVAKASVSYTLGAGVRVETLQTTNAAGTGAINLSGNEFDNAVLGNAGANTLKGGGGMDSINGGAGNDKIYGGAANDILSGGAGTDSFYFDTVPNATNRDRIEDFSPVADSIYLKKSGVFAGIANLGTLSSAAFKQIDNYNPAAPGARTTVTDDYRIIYDKISGKLYYDADGHGGSATAVLFAIVSNGTAHPTLTNADFIVF